jgi:WD40 repeat protein
MVQIVFFFQMKGSLILSGDSSGRVFFWNKLSGECEAAVRAHQESVNTIVYREGRFYTASG